MGGPLRSNTVGFPSAQSTIQRAAEGGVEEPHLHHHQFDPKGKGRDYEKSEDWPKISRKRDQIIREMWSSERVLASGLLVVTEVSPTTRAPDRAFADLIPQTALYAAPDR